MMKKPEKVPQYPLTLAEFERFVPGSCLQFVPDELWDFGSKGPFLPPSLARRALLTRGWRPEFQVWAFMNLKGGVGKTTACMTLATRAAQLGIEVCLLDLDSQGSASLAFDQIPEEGDPIFYDVWQDPANELEPALRSLAPHLKLLPSSLENGLLDAALASPKHQKHAVRGVCEQLRLLGQELVLIDCPPSLGTAVISSICAANRLIVPVIGDPFSFRGLELTLQETKAICETYGLPEPELRVLYSRFDRRERMAKSALERLQSQYCERWIPHPIGVSADFSKALERRETIFAGMRSSSAREDYDRCLCKLLGLEAHSEARNSFEEI